MKTVFITLLVGIAAASLSWAGPKVRWPRDVVEWKNLEEGKKKASEEGDAIAVIFVPADWGDSKDEGVVRSIEATGDAIGALKSFCVIVKGDLNAVRQAAQGQDKSVPEALVNGVGAAGNSYPLVVVLDAEMSGVLGATSGQAISEQGSKVFREAKKKHREQQKAKEEKDD